ncbi:hypothetical protein [Polynucleobacter asymbioticus]|uniref:Lipoprotein n=1 Tax=Polynucleobacter asymbioticus (strain DSM 18221 / CIP 109841 / QLW-P1DMWA-1) TaxID=312153 RepID=A4SY58_POLAQ|nr:hypothetical protein [Polynucleobacter asymbioticus]ABP34422.1 conserved hypothetical protein [Polynucleobacter asymbioticus QLW-P1DMWA-1]APC07138.1 hypothetical protein AOC10_06855 [Polynucleobacter asymbioticus]
MNSKSYSSVILAASLICFGSVSYAENSKWEQNHPRRSQVNERLENQNRRITNEVKSGEMSKSQAQALRQNDKNIRQEERNMASQNGGHITKTEQNTLNQQLNQNSAAIGK